MDCADEIRFWESLEEMEENVRWWSVLELGSGCSSLVTVETLTPHGADGSSERPVTGKIHCETCDC